MLRFLRYIFLIFDFHWGYESASSRRSAHWGFLLFDIIFFETFLFRDLPLEFVNRILPLWLLWPVLIVVVWGRGSRAKVMGRYIIRLWILSKFLMLEILNGVLWNNKLISSIVTDSRDHDLLNPALSSLSLDLLSINFPRQIREDPAVHVLHQPSLPLYFSGSSLYPFTLEESFFLGWLCQIIIFISLHIL